MIFMDTLNVFVDIGAIGAPVLTSRPSARVLLVVGVDPHVLRKT